MSPFGQSSEQIASTPYIDGYLWHIYKSVAWLDLAKRTADPGSLHYAAIELRYGIEYLLFTLLVIRSKGLSEEEYRKCLGDPKAMSKALKSPKLSYNKLADFTQIVLQFERGLDGMHVWSLPELLKWWGVASEFLHFCGSHSRTHLNDEWFIKSTKRLEEAIAPMWNLITTTKGFALLDVDELESEVHDTWTAFSNDKLDLAGVRVRLHLIQPALRDRHKPRIRL